MGYLGRRIGLSQDNGDSNPGAAGGAVGGGLLDLFAHGYFEQQGDIFNDPGAPPSGLTATGGIISDYTSGSDVYRAHIFTSSGTFDVTAPGDFGDTVDYLVVAGGGGGGSDSSGTGRGSGGGGAGGFRTNLSGHPLASSAAFPVSTSPGSYTVTVGGGGIKDVVGTDSVFGSITSNGGGRGSLYPGSEAGGAGGSGGGGHGDAPNAGGATVAVSTPSPWPGPSVQGYAGGTGANVSAGGAGGGGGAGAVGSNASGTAGGAGGAGSPIAIETNTAKTYAGGGGGGGGSGTHGAGGAGGGGRGGPPNSDTASGTYSTGGGGGGTSGPSGSGGQGGSGVIVVRYKIAELTATAKATGGAISFYSGKTIHAFTNSGTFATTSDWSAGNVEYIVVAGGGGGGRGGSSEGSGGGGAGGYRTGTTPIGAHPVSTSIQVGAGGLGGFDGVATNGTPSYFGTPITSAGGGAGSAGKTAGNAIDGGSGGGGGYVDNSGGSGNTPPVSPVQGYGGGDYSAYGGGGGGGAGGAGANSTGPTTNPFGGPGGIGVQLPSTFRDPKAASSLGVPGPGGASYWVGGGGGGGTYDPGLNPTGGGRGGSGDSAGSPAAGPYAGGGNGGAGESTLGGTGMTDGTTNTGGGGGGNAVATPGRSGGSGIVLIAYPS